MVTWLIAAGIRVSLGNDSDINERQRSGRHDYDLTRHCFYLTALDYVASIVQCQSCHPASALIRIPPSTIAEDAPEVEPVVHTRQTVIRVDDDEESASSNREKW